MGLGGALRGRGWRVEGLGRLWPGRLAELSTMPGSGGQFLLVAGQLRACGVPAVRRLEFPLCAGLEFGALRGAGVGLEVNRTDVRLHAAVAFSPRLSWAVHEHVALFVGPEVTAALLRPEFAVADAGLVHRSGAIGVRALAGVAARFP